MQVPRELVKIALTTLLSAAPACLAVGQAAQPPAPAPDQPVNTSPAQQQPVIPQPMQQTQPGPTQAGPIAIVPLDSKDPGSAAIVTGALQVANGRAMIATNGAITAGTSTTEVTLPHRGVLRVCSSTTVKLATDASVPKDEIPGLMMVMDHGAMEASFATGRNSDVLLTPDFRILIGGPGAADVKVRLGQDRKSVV